MRKLILILLFAFSISKAQYIWYENFGFSCNSGQSAANASPTPTNGAWSISTLTIPYTNGSVPNEWFVSAKEQGQLPGNCSGLSCGGTDNRSLHIGANSISPLNIDPSASYLSGINNITNKRVESPTINCMVKSGIQLSFYYFAKGVSGSDYCDVLYSSNGGATWNTLVTLAQTPNSGCSVGEVQWTYTAIPLPASVDNNPNVKIAFQWQNNDPTGSSKSIAIDDVGFSSLTINNQTTVPCPQQTVVAQKTNTVIGITSYTWIASPNNVTFNPVNSPTTTVTYGGGGIYTISLLGSSNPGPYTVKASRIDTINISLPINASPPATICIGGITTLTASGANTYTWRPNSPADPSISNASFVTVSPTVTTNYFVNGLLGMCQSNSIICQVIVSNSLLVTASSSQTILCSGQSATITANGANTYTWINVGNNPSIVVSPTISTTYTVIGYNGACSDTIVFSQIVANCTGLDELNFGEAFSIFPNPFSNELNFVSNGEMEICIRNTLGEVVKQTTALKNISITTSEFSAGVYFVSIKTQQETKIIKLIKN